MLIYKIQHYLTDDHHLFAEARMISIGIDKPKGNVAKVSKNKDKPVSIWENLQNLGNKITKLISSAQKDPNLTKKIQKLADRANKIRSKVEGRKKNLLNKTLAFGFDKNGKLTYGKKKKEALKNRGGSKPLSTRIIPHTDLVKGFNDIEKGKSKITKGDLDSI